MSNPILEAKNIKKLSTLFKYNHETQLEELFCETCDDFISMKKSSCFICLSYKHYQKHHGVVKNFKSCYYHQSLIEYEEAKAKAQKENLSTKQFKYREFLRSEIQKHNLFNKEMFKWSIAELKEFYDSDEFAKAKQKRINNYYNKK